MNALDLAARRLRQYWVSIVVFISFIVLWQAIVVLFDIPAFIIPAPSVIYEGLASSPGVWIANAWVTLYETLSGFLVAVVAGVGMAMLLTYSQRLRDTAYPFILILQIVPKVAIAPIFFLLLGLNATPRILVVFLIAFFPIVIDTEAGLNGIDPEYIELLRSLKASKFKIYTKARFPNALPYLFNAMKVAITLALVGAIVAEFVQSSSGLGFILLSTLSNLQIAKAFADITILSVIGIGTFIVISILESLIIPWYARSKSIRN